MANRAWVKVSLKQGDLSWALSDGKPSKLIGSMPLVFNVENAGHSPAFGVTGIAGGVMRIFGQVNDSSSKWDYSEDSTSMCKSLAADARPELGQTLFPSEKSDVNAEGNADKGIGFGPVTVERTPQLIHGDELAQLVIVGCVRYSLRSDHDYHFTQFSYYIWPFQENIIASTGIPIRGQITSASAMMLVQTQEGNKAN